MSDGQIKVAYWPGCVSRGFTPELHGSMEKIAPTIGDKFKEKTAFGKVADHGFNRVTCKVTVCA